MGQQQPASAIEQFRVSYWEEVSGPMSECERRLAEAAGSTGGTLGEACSLTLVAGGKRLRPMLVYLTTKPSHGIEEDQHEAAVAVELVHMATLVHDDVLDGAMLRRGAPTMVAGFGLAVSVAAGDYLFSRAFAALTETGSGRAVSLLTGASLGLSLGELSQMKQAGDINLSYEAYEERCRLKTAGLFSAACQLGAVLSGCSQDTILALERYGRCLGLSFQIIDDILDFAGEESETGKRVGTDLRDGTVTLPLIIALELDPSLAGLFAQELTEERITEIVTRVNESGAVERARGKALEYVAEAVGVLEAAADELDTAPLALIAGITVQRKV